MRANKPEINSTVNNTTSSAAPTKTVCSTPNKNQSSHNASPATANSTQQSVTSGAPTIPPTSSTTSITSSNSSSSGGVAPSQIQAIATRDENHSHVTKTISTRGDQQPLQNSIIPTTAPVAFAAVAKHSTSQHTANEGKCTRRHRSHSICHVCKISYPKRNENKANTETQKTKGHYFNRCFFKFLLFVSHSKLCLGPKDNCIRHLHRQRYLRLPVIRTRLLRIKHLL